jgi:hypothetical protein
MGGRPTERALSARREEIEELFLQGATASEIAQRTKISDRTVRRHLDAIQASWAERNPSLDQARTWLIALAGSLDRAAALGAEDLPSSAPARVGYLKLRLNAQERLARLLGVDAPARGELSGPNGTPVQIAAGRAHLSRAQMLELLKAETEDLP